MTDTPKQAVGGTPDGKEVDFPFDELVRGIDMLLEKLGDRIAVFQRFTCEACRNRLTMREADTFNEECECELCHHVTNVKANGCGMLIVGGESKQKVMEWVAERQGFGPTIPNQKVN